MLKHLSIILILAAFLTACATESSPRPKVSAQEPLLEPVPEFLAEQEYLRGELEKGNPRKFDESDWATFEVIQNKFQTLLADVDDVSELSSSEKRELYDARYQLKLLLLGDGDLVCMEREPPVGSRIAPRKVCVPRDRLEDEEYAADLWKTFYEAAPQRHDQ